MFAAVGAHKFVIAFCIGVELVAAKTGQRLSIIYICIFAVVSPLGIGIGMLLVGGGSAAASGPLPVILQVIQRTHTHTHVWRCPTIKRAQKNFVAKERKREKKTTL